MAGKNTSAYGIYRTRAEVEFALFGLTLDVSFAGVYPVRSVHLGFR